MARGWPTATLQNGSVRAVTRKGVVTTLARDLVPSVGSSHLFGLSVAGLPAGYSRPGLDDDAGRLVAEHHRVNARRIADSAFGVSVHIGAADADRLDAHLNFACPGRRDRAIHELKLTLSDQLGDASPGHFDPLPGCGAFRSVSFAMSGRSGTRAVANAAPLVGGSMDRSSAFMTQPIVNAPSTASTPATSTHAYVPS